MIEIILGVIVGILAVAFFFLLAEFFSLKSKFDALSFA